MLQRSEKLEREMSVGHQDNSNHPALPFVAMSRSTAQRLAVVRSARLRIAVPLGSRRRRIDRVGWFRSKVYRHPVTQALPLPYFVQCGEIGKGKAAACVTVPQGVVKKGLFLSSPSDLAA